jgi:hypothetical protein
MSASDEVDTATGEAPVRVDVVQLLNDKRRALNEAREKYVTARTMRDEGAMAHLSAKIDALKNTIIPELERDAQVVVEAAGRKAAEERLLGIRRAHGSAVATYGEDEKRVEQAVAALSEAITTLNGRSRKIEALRAEASSLSDRFSLTVPKLTMPPEPQLNLNAALPPVWEYRVVRPSFEQCEHGLRTRRDYTEIAGTPGYAIIQTSGLRPFRALTEQEKEVLEDKAEWKPDPVLAQAATEVNALGKLGVPGGHVARG